MTERLTSGGTTYELLQTSYDAQGRLIAESSAAGVIQKEYIYLGDIPVAVLQAVPIRKTA